MIVHVRSDHIFPLHLIVPGILNRDTTLIINRYKRIFIKTNGILPVFRYI